MRLPVPIDTAVLLAAGRGARLSPWTERTPEPLLVHRGRPTLDLVLDSLARAGISRVVLVTHHLAEQFEPYAAQRAAATGQRIMRVRQDRLFGTAHALQCVMFARPELLVTPFVLSAADYLVPPAFYADLLRFHASHDAPLSVSLRAGGEGVTTPSGVRFADPDVDLDVDPGAEAGDGIGAAEGDDPSGRDILEFVEKPAPGTAQGAFAANLCFVLPPELLAHVGETDVSARGAREIRSTINAWLAAGGRARGLLQPTPPEWTPPAEGRG